jgi:hypothetical protein
MARDTLQRCHLLLLAPTPGQAMPQKTDQILLSALVESLKRQVAWRSAPLVAHLARSFASDWWQILDA